MVARDVAHAPHVRGERVHLIDSARRLQALVEASQVTDLEFVGIDLGVLGQLQIDSAHDVALRLQEGDEVVADEPACTGHQHSRPVRVHTRLLPSIARVTSSR